MSDETPMDPATIAGRQAEERAIAWACGASVALYGGFEMSHEALLEAAKRDAATLTVNLLYATFDVPMLEEILAVGRKYEGEDRREEVLYMNEALAALILRKKAAR